MNITSFPPWLQFIITVVCIFGSIELGNRIGLVLERKQKSEKDGIIAVVSGSILGLLSFLLAFTFGIAFDRHEVRKSLVREEANQISTVWYRSDFMPEPGRSDTRKLLKEYLDLRLGIIQPGDTNIARIFGRTEQIQDELWTLSVPYAKAELNSDIGAMYFDALNRLVDIHGLRIAIGYKDNLPWELWVSLYIILVCAMVSIGYYAALIQSKMSLAFIILAFSFALAVGIIANLDQVKNSHFAVSQQPLLDLQLKIAGQ